MKILVCKYCGIPFESDDPETPTYEQIQRELTQTQKQLREAWQAVHYDPNERTAMLLAYKHDKESAEVKNRELAAQVAVMEKALQKIALHRNAGVSGLPQRWARETLANLPAEAEKLVPGEGMVMVPEEVAEAAMLWTYCPVQGGYKDGSAIEDICEELSRVVEKWTGIIRDDEWRTETETIAMLKAAKEGK